MLHYLEFANFCSFVEPEQISFVVDAKAPDTYQFVHAASKARLSKAQALIGPNASGKTNALRTLTFVAWFVRDSHRVLEPDELIPVDEHRFYGDESGQPPMKFLLQFELPETKGTVYRYELELTTERVLHEKLSQKVDSKKFRYLIKRDYSHGKDTVETKELSLGISDKMFSTLLRSNASVLSTARQLKLSALTPVLSFFDSIVSNVDRYGLRFHTRHDPTNSAQFFNENKGLFQQAKHILTGLDFGIADIQLLSESVLFEGENEPTEIVIPFAVHRIKEQEYKLPFWSESGGTQVLFSLLRWLLPVLKNGGVAVFDDFDSELHPHMLPRLFELFFEPSTNPHNAQLIFSTHAYPEVYRRFDKRQITIVEKGEDGISHLYRLDSIKDAQGKGIRQDDNMLAKYDAGAYGGVPIF